MENTPPEIKKQEPDLGLCVIQTVESILTSIENSAVKLSPNNTELRINQMKQAMRLLEKRLESFPIDTSNIMTFSTTVDRRKRKEMEMQFPAIRMDMMAFQRFISTLKSETSKVGQLLSNCEIEYKKGGVEEITEYLKDGWQVGVIAPFLLPSEEVGLHVFHAVLDSEGNLTDLSDKRSNNYMLEIVQRSIESGELEIGCRNLIKKTNGSNLVLIRPKNQPE